MSTSSSTTTSMSNDSSVTYTEIDTILRMYEDLTERDLLLVKEEIEDMAIRKSYATYATRFAVARRA